MNHRHRHIWSSDTKALPARRRALWVAILFMAFMAGALTPATARVAQANAITVNSVLDSSGNPSICTLRDAILAANSNAPSGGCAAGAAYPAMDNINLTFNFSTLHCRLNPCNIVLSGPLPAVSEDVTITSVGSWTPTINGLNTYRVFDLQAVTVNISKLYIYNGKAGAGSYGGAIQTSPSGTILYVSNVTFFGNQADLGGGAIRVNGSTVVVSNSTFISNTAVSLGGAIAQQGGLLIVNGTTFWGNSARDGGGIVVGQGSEARLTNVTLSSNNSTQSAGGLLMVGSSNSVSMNNLTITRNTADSDNNGSGDGGGIWRGGGTATVYNTIIAGNFDTPNNAGPGTIYPDCAVNTGGTLTSFGYNLLGRSNGCAGLTHAVNGDQVGTSANPINALLYPIAANGGPPTPQVMLTHSLSPGSPAIDAGNPVELGGFAACAAADQRGIARPVGVRCDIGAFESPPIFRLFQPLIRR